MIKGQYIDLRVIEKDDEYILKGWASDEEVCKFTPTVFPNRQLFIKNGLKGVYSDKSSINLLIQIEDDVPIGICSLYNIDFVNSTAEISVTIYAKNCWGRGYGFDALKTITEYGLYEINLHTIYANIIEDNERAIKCFEKAGYEKEGILFERLYKDGCYKNLVSMSIVKK